MRTLYENGRILTGRGLLEDAPEFVSSLLVQNGIVVGAGVPDRRVDLGGRFAMPGFNDAHLHLGEGARHAREVDLAGTRSLAEALERIAAAAARTPKGAWLTGGGWDESCWAERRLPTRGDLDRVTGDCPAVFARVDVHVSTANSRALALGGVTRETAAPAGSGIDRDPSGEPTGILRERPARDLVERHVPPATLAARMGALRAVLLSAAARGLTSVQDNSTDEDFAALCALEDPPIRISEWLPFDAPLPELLDRRARGPRGQMLRTGMLKAFLDGSLGSRTAAMLAPYSDRAGERGLLFYDEPRLTAMALERAEAGFALGFHAIGDRALAQALRVFTAVRRAFPHILCRVEHAQTAAPEAFREAREAGIVASMQPNHWLSDRRWAPERLGAERAARAYAWRSFREAGVPLAFGTDFPVEPIAPFPGLCAAVSREGQSIPIGAALHAYTRGAAFAEGAEGWKGLLAPGFAADLCVLDRDLLACAPEQLAAARVLRTVVAGRTVYEGDTG